MNAERIKLIVRGFDPRLVEALMRSNTLGAFNTLDATEFSAEARKAAYCIDEGGTDMAERLAQTYGL